MPDAYVSTPERGLCVVGIDYHHIMKPTIIIIIASIALIGGLAWLGSGSAAPADPATSTPGSSVLSIADPTYDFGTISMKNGTVTREFVVTNTGNGSVTVERISTSCMCTSAALRIGEERFGPFGMQGHGFIPRINAPLAPGQEATLLVTFDPAAHGPAGVGPIQRTVTVENDGGSPVTVSFKANVTP